MIVLTCSRVCFREPILPKVFLGEITYWPGQVILNILQVVLSLVKCVVASCVGCVFIYRLCVLCGYHVDILVMTLNSLLGTAFDFHIVYQGLMILIDQCTLLQSKL